MIYIGTLLCVSLLLNVILAYKFNYWKGKFIDSGYMTELELATFEQIVKELKSRPEGYMIVRSKNLDIITVNGETFSKENKGVMIIGSKMVDNKLTINSNYVNSEFALPSLKKTYKEMISKNK